MYTREDERKGKRENSEREREKCFKTEKLLNTKVLARETVGEHHHQELLLSHSRGERERETCAAAC